MIVIKTRPEIEIMKKGGRLLAQTFEEVLRAVKSNKSLQELDQLAESLLKKTGGRPSFQMVPRYHWATCLNVNQGVVHGIPGKYRLKNGDLLSLDMGLFYRGFHTDMAWTTVVGEKKGVKKPFLAVGKRALKKAIQAAKPGNRVGHLSAAMEREIKKAGYFPIKTLTGHGVGQKLHEPPAIPCYLRNKLEATPELKSGMVLAIEVIYSQGSPKILLKDDGWTIETKSGCSAALFEKTISVQAEKPLILT